MSCSLTDSISAAPPSSEETCIAIQGDITSRCHPTCFFSKVCNFVGSKVVGLVSRTRALEGAQSCWSQDVPNAINTRWIRRLRTPSSPFYFCNCTHRCRWCRLNLQGRETSFFATVSQSARVGSGVLTSLGYRRAAWRWWRSSWPIRAKRSRRQLRTTASQTISSRQRACASLLERGLVLMQCQPCGS